MFKLLFFLNCLDEDALELRSLGMVSLLQVCLENLLLPALMSLLQLAKFYLVTTYRYQRLFFNSRGQRESESFERFKKSKSPAYDKEFSCYPARITEWSNGCNLLMVSGS